MGLLDDALKRQLVWAKARHIPGREHEAHEWGMDDYGAIIRYSHYGDRSSPYGWEYDHVVPSAVGGADHHSNLRPLHYRNNASLGGILGNLMNSLGSR